jgi:hypothetical protein
MIMKSHNKKRLLQKVQKSQKKWKNHKLLPQKRNKLYRKEVERKKMTQSKLNSQKI